MATSNLISAADAKANRKFWASMDRELVQPRRRRVRRIPDVTRQLRYPVGYRLTRGFAILNGGSL